MATPKKKHLIELMIEEGVEWQDGAEYAAQDKRDCKVYFFIRKPSVMARDNYYSSQGGPIGYPHLLPSLCRNWHQAIVTREQYAEAVAAACDKTSQSKESEDVGQYAMPENTESLTINLVPQNGFYKLNGTSGTSSQPAAHLHSGEAGVIPPETIESLLAEIKAKREEHEAIVVEAEELALEIASIEQRVNDKLKEYGFAVSPLAVPSCQVYEQWKIGDKCIVADSPSSPSLIGKECVLTNIDSGDRNLTYRVELRNGDNYWVREILRP